MVTGHGGRSGGGGASGSWIPDPLFSPFLLPAAPYSAPYIPVIPAMALHSSTRRWESGWVPYPEGYNPTQDELFAWFKSAYENSDIWTVEMGNLIWQRNPGVYNSRLMPAALPEEMALFLRDDIHWIEETEQTISIVQDFQLIEGNERVRTTVITNDYIYYNFIVSVPVIPVPAIVILLPVLANLVGSGVFSPLIQKDVSYAKRRFRR
jgi:hypothetical protein